MMRLLLGEEKSGPIFSGALALAAVALLAFTVFTSDRLSTVGPLLALGVIFAVAHQAILRWRSLIALIVIVILYIPMKRYSLPASLPINLEPYRLLVFFVAVGWVTSLLIDPRVRFRRTPVDGPLVLFAFIALSSDLANRGRVSSVQSEVVRKFLFFLTYFIVFYLTVSVVRRFSEVEFVTRVLVAGAAVVGVLALVERNTGYDVFNHLQTVVPFLHLDAHQIPHLHRGGRLRVYASSQHPIALGAALAMLVPFGIYLTRRSAWWWSAAVLLALGSLATGSRTAAVMFAVIVLSYLLLRPVQVRRFWPALIPALLVIHLATPGALGAIKEAFFPKGGLIAQEHKNSVGSGRLATLSPALRREFDPNPLLGEGFGTRVPVKTPTVPVPNGPIFDDQWLGILCETGLAGALTLGWLFVRLIRRLLPEAKDDRSDRSWFLVAVIASTSSFAASMLFYDTFSFIQVTFLLFITMGLGVSAYLAPEPARLEARAAKRTARGSLVPRLDDPHGLPG
jgi:hypothetical protein